MPIEAVIAALAAAVLHAVWNALVKGGGDPQEIARFIMLVERSGALRSQSMTKTADRSVRIALLDVLNEMG